MLIKYFGGDSSRIEIHSAISEKMLDAYIAFETYLGELLPKYNVSQEDDEKLRAVVEALIQQSYYDALHKGMTCAILGWDHISDLVLENPDEAIFQIRHR